MRSVICGILVLLACCWCPAEGWGYIFSRFRPESQNNLGYGSAGYSGYNGPLAERLVSPREQLMEALLSEEILEEQGCEGRRCTANEHCCGGHVCVDFDGASGTCLSSVGQREGAECRSDSECAAGLLCDMGSCVQFQGKKRYNEPCSVSTECEIGRGLCCQVVRRHRQAPKTLCGYFKDPMICIGHVATDQVQHIVEHTDGEKRLTGKTHDYVSI
ncbi:ITG-like peptide isoform X2 [Penaeus chinensis]|uniref:ITG-like peptide isoform X2 n=1 Tax=Penaeus chinensis TaxID=139456 RepID=UPI001FB74426|nr:ITG-like peptide isoform X2 [Penaeus chinensis]